MACSTPKSTIAIPRDAPATGRRIATGMPLAILEGEEHKSAVLKASRAPPRPSQHALRRVSMQIYMLSRFTSRLGESGKRLMK